MSDSENELDMAFIEDDSTPEPDENFMVGDLETPELTNPTSATKATTTTGGRRRRRRSRRRKSRRGRRKSIRRRRRHSRRH